MKTNHSTYLSNSDGSAFARCHCCLFHSSPPRCLPREAAAGVARVQPLENNHADDRDNTNKSWNLMVLAMDFEGPWVNVRVALQSREAANMLDLERFLYRSHQVPTSY